MRKIKFEDCPTLKNPEEWDLSFVDFIKSCLVKDPQQRPTADQVLKMNKKFFAKAKNKSYLVETLLKGIPTVQERVIILFNSKFGKMYSDYVVQEENKDLNGKPEDYVK